MSWTSFRAGTRWKLGAQLQTKRKAKISSILRFRREYLRVWSPPKRLKFHDEKTVFYIGTASYTHEIDITWGRIPTPPTFARIDTSLFYCLDCPLSMVLDRPRVVQAGCTCASEAMCSGIGCLSDLIPRQTWDTSSRKSYSAHLLISDALRMMFALGWPLTERLLSLRLARTFVRTFHADDRIPRMNFFF